MMVDISPILGAAHWPIIETLELVSTKPFDCTADTLLNLINVF